MSESLISVIVLTYKSGEFLYETLDSVFAQNHSKIELIVADDGSPDFDIDRVQQYIQEHAKDNIVNSVVLDNKINRGTVKNINSALDVVQGDYINIIAGDDTYASNDIFSRQADYLDSHEEMLVVGNIIECDEHMNDVGRVGFAPCGKLNMLKASREKLLRFVCKKMSSLLATQATCYRRQFFIQTGQFDERFKLIEDFPTTVRIITNNYPIGYFDISVVKHRSGTGVSTSNKAFDIGKIKYYSDLKLFYECYLMPISPVVGRLFVKMRHRMCCFRIDYSLAKSENKSKSYLFGIVARNVLPLFYYFLTNFKRVKFFLNK